MKQKHIPEMNYLKKYSLFHFIVMSSTCRINYYRDNITPCANWSLMMYPDGVIFL
jgi:hypothetical protein